MSQLPKPLEKTKRAAIEKTIAHGIWIVILFAFLMIVQNEVIAEASQRHLFLLVVVIMIVATVLLVFARVNDLKESGDDKALIAKEKFRAELAAGVAIFAFFLSFYRAGFDLDRANHNARLAHLYKAYNTVHELMDCKTNTAPDSPCAQLYDSFSQASGAIVTADESAIDKTASNFIFAMESAPKSDATSVKQWSKKIAFAREEVLLAKVEDFAMKLTTALALIVLLLGSSMAISRKIALAWYDMHK